MTLFSAGMKCPRFDRNLIEVLLFRSYNWEPLEVSVAQHPGVCENNIKWSKLFRKFLSLLTWEQALFDQQESIMYFSTHKIISFIRIQTNSKTEINETTFFEEKELIRLEKYNMFFEPRAEGMFQTASPLENKKILQQSCNKNLEEPYLFTLLHHVLL
ncbi:hypothetical protein ACJX0J_010287 [Zea mays]